MSDDQSLNRKRRLEFLLERREIAAADQQLADCLRQLNGVTFDGFVEEIGLEEQLSKAWGKINSIDTVPSSAIDEDAPEAAFSEWLFEAQLLIDGEEEYLLSHSPSQRLARLKVSKGHRWLSEIWNIIVHKDFVIIAVNQHLLIGFIDEEHYYGYFTQLW